MVSQMETKAALEGQFPDGLGREKPLFVNWTPLGGGLGTSFPQKAALCRQMVNSPWLCRGKGSLAPHTLGLNTHGPLLVTKVLNLSGVSAVLGFKGSKSKICFEALNIHQGYGAFMYKQTRAFDLAPHPW